MSTVTSNESALVDRLMHAPFATSAMRREAAETIARLMVERDEAKAAVRTWEAVHGNKPPGNETGMQHPDAWLVLEEDGYRFLSGGEGQARERMSRHGGVLYPLYRGQPQEAPKVLCTCVEDGHSEDCIKDGCCGQCKGHTLKAGVQQAQRVHFWYVEELHNGDWVRSAVGHAWALESDARQQCEELRRRYGNRVYRVAENEPPALNGG